MEAGGIWELSVFSSYFAVNLKLLLKLKSIKINNKNKKAPLSFPEYHHLLIFGSLENHENSPRFKVLYMPSNVCAQSPMLLGWVRINENDLVREIDSSECENQRMYFMMALD